MHKSQHFKLTLAALALAASSQALAARYELTVSGGWTEGAGDRKDYWSPTFRSAITGSSNSDFTGLFYSLSLTLESDAPFGHSGVTRFSDAIVGGQLTIGAGDHVAIDNFSFSSSPAGRMTFWPTHHIGSAQHYFKTEPAAPAHIAGSTYDKNSETWRSETFELSEIFLNLSYPATLQHWGNDGKAFTPWFKDASGALLSGPNRSYLRFNFQGHPQGMWGSADIGGAIDRYSLRPLSAVPEPSSYLLFVTGLLALPLLRRRESKPDIIRTHA